MRGMPTLYKDEAIDQFMKDWATPFNKAVILRWNPCFNTIGTRIQFKSL